MITTTKSKFQLIIDHLTRNRVKPAPATLEQIRDRARAQAAAARAKPANVSAESARTSQAAQIVDAVELARAVQVELARRYAPTAAPTAAAKPQPVPTAKPQPPKLDGAAQAQAHFTRVEKAKRVAQTMLLGGALAAEEKRRRQPPADPGAGLSGPALLDKYMSVDASEARAILATHGEELKAAAEAAGIELDVGQHRNLSGIERAEAALRLQFPITS